MASFKLKSDMALGRYPILSGSPVTASDEPVKSFTVQVGAEADKALSITDLAGVATLGYKVSVADSVMSGMFKGKPGSVVALTKDDVSSKCAAALSVAEKTPLNLQSCLMRCLLLTAWTLPR